MGAIGSRQAARRQTRRFNPARPRERRLAQTLPLQAIASDRKIAPEF